METKIYFLLHSLGIGAKYRGFRYLAYGIALCMEDEDYLLRVSKTLYPKIAQTFQVSSSCVETRHPHRYFRLLDPRKP